MFSIHCKINKKISFPHPNDWNRWIDNNWIRNGWLLEKKKLFRDETSGLPLQHMVFVKCLGDNFANVDFVDVHDLLVTSDSTDRPATHSIHTEGFHKGQETQVFEDDR